MSLPPTPSLGTSTQFTTPVSVAPTSTTGNTDSSTSSSTPLSTGTSSLSPSSSSASLSSLLSSSIASPPTTSTITTTSSAIASSTPIAASTPFTSNPSSSTSSITISSPTSTSGTNIVTSTQLITASPSSVQTSTIFDTITRPLSSSSTSTATSLTDSPSTSTTSSPSGLQGNGADGSSNGLSPSGITAVAVVVPIVVVALIVILGIYCWRKRRHRKTSKEERRKEVEEYGYNPNNDPALPKILSPAGPDSHESAEEAGYRGWGTNGNASLSFRKPSTNASQTIGLAFLDDESHDRAKSTSAGRYSTPDELPGVAASGSGTDVGEGSENLHSKTTNGKGIQRGLSNASSSYSTAYHTDDSGEAIGNTQDVADDLNYSQYAPYSTDGNGVRALSGSQPVVRDVNARRNTKIHNVTNQPLGNSGIAQNF